MCRHERYGQALHAIPIHWSKERNVLQNLHRHGPSEHGYLRAFLTIPYSSRTLYGHSLTSLLWNHTASYRIHTYGLRAVEGDLVVKESSAWKDVQTSEVSPR